MRLNFNLGVVFSSYIIESSINAIIDWCDCFVLHYYYFGFMLLED